jgi:hypothetical protein
LHACAQPRGCRSVGVHRIANILKSSISNRQPSLPCPARKM